MKWLPFASHACAIALVNGEACLDMFESIHAAMQVFRVFYDSACEKKSLASVSFLRHIICNGGPRWYAVKAGCHGRGRVLLR